MSDDFKKTFEKILRGEAPIIRPLTIPGDHTISSSSFPIKPQDETGRLRAQVLRLEGRINELKGRVATLERQVEGLREQLRLRDIWTAAVAMPAWITKHLRFLIFVCHPDRNAGRQEAAEITRELLALRGKDCL